MSELKLEAGFKEPKISGLPDGWKFKRLEEFSKFFQGGKLGLTKEYDYVSSGVPAFSAAGQDGYVEKCEFNNSDAVILSAIGANCGRCFYASGDWTTLANVQAIVPESDVIAKYLFFRVSIEGYWTRSGSAQPFIKPSSAKKSWIAYPASTLVQSKIVEVLDTIDEAIEQTEALIEKYSLVKAGMMHDLFTRGLTPDGKLRPPREEAPDLYKETPIGWLPKEWDYADIGTLKETLVDGPFGSNLKTEHYVTDPGVRVVRLQNIQSGKYNDADRAYVSDAHALALSRNKVVGNDILIAGLGEDRYPVARACLYPVKLPPALNKADCFRLRCDSSKVINPFMMFFLNTPPARQQVRRYEQGVTRPRINLGNMNRILAPKPDLDEQALICERLLKLDDLVALETDKRLKLSTKKTGLMRDLLTGEVTVKVDEPEAAHV